MCLWMGSLFHDWTDYSIMGLDFKRVSRVGSHIFGFLRKESCSYLRLANVPGYL